MGLRDAGNKVIRADLIGGTITAEGISCDDDEPFRRLRRQLVDAGHDPRSSLEIYRDGTLYLRVKLIGH